MGLVFQLNPPNGSGAFIYFDNYVFKKSEWSCGTMPPGWTCKFSGNESGQPMRLEVTVTNAK